MDQDRSRAVARQVDMDCPRRRGELRIYLGAAPGVGRTFAMRRRLAHGNVCPAHRIDAALGNYSRPGNLTALCELALSWVADQVDVALRRYMAELLADAEESADRLTGLVHNLLDSSRLATGAVEPNLTPGFTEAMGGTVRAEDTPGGGLTLVISLPAVG
jgi:K+-sensing histidine kinase KdpD